MKVSFAQYPARKLNMLLNFNSCLESHTVENLHSQAGGCYKTTILNSSNDLYDQICKRSQPTSFHTNCKFLQPIEIKLLGSTLKYVRGLLHVIKILQVVSRLLNFLLRKLWQYTQFLFRSTVTLELRLSALNFVNGNYDTVSILRLVIFFHVFYNAKWLLWSSTSRY